MRWCGGGWGEFDEDAGGESVEGIPDDYEPVAFGCWPSGVRRRARSGAVARWRG